MPGGVVFLIVVPTANFERELLNKNQYDKELYLGPSGRPQTTPMLQPSRGALPIAYPHIPPNSNNNLNINLPENNATLRLEVELRDKHTRNNQRGGGGNGGVMNVGRGGRGKGGGGVGFLHKRNDQHSHDMNNENNINYLVPMEKVLEELLTKLEIEHVTWVADKKGHYHQVVFPIGSGDPCETTLHCLTELKIGIKYGSSVSVLPCSVTYDALKDGVLDEEEVNDEEELSKWNNFVESIKSKLTVKQVVDGVRAGGALSFDYIALIVTADSLAALGLVENNAPNITAAMLVSPLMGPVMSITFGAMIADRELVKTGFISLILGMVISLVFGFIFGLILGSTEMPWGFTDWPTEEMKGRGNARSLWMGILWALTSGTGVAVALLNGSAGPLIGVAISASLLPPVVNCGLFWSMACTWLLNEGIKIPHLKGESYTGNSSYVPLYTNYMPTEFLINGIVSAMLTVINVICIFITAIIVLKIKEVAAPYTASPDLRRFWETDIRAVRKTNRSTIRRGNAGGIKMNQYEQQLNSPNGGMKNLEATLEQALIEATDDETFRKVKRMSYSNHAVDGLQQRLGLTNNNRTGSPGNMTPIRNSKLVDTDLATLDKLVTAILQRQNQQPLQKLAHLRSFSRRGGGGGDRSSGILDRNSNGGPGEQMPTIMEANIVGVPAGSSGVGGIGGGNHSNFGGDRRSISNNDINRTVGNRTLSWSENTRNNNNNNNNSVPGVRQIINSISNAPHRFSQGGGISGIIGGVSGNSGGGSNNGNDDETKNLTRNMLD